MLPWLALTAQLPFAAGAPWPNFMSWCLALGSPALATFSLVITIMNRNHVHSRFASLKRETRDSNLLVRVNAAECLLSKGQQVPSHIRDVNGFDTLLHAEESQSWWQGLPSRLKESQRTVTPAFVAQYALAVLAWVFTLSSTFMSAMKEGRDASQLSTSNL